jgi:Rrf2 family transcriptional regulator, nitric oxide-sensitive transcriptional repressor
MRMTLYTEYALRVLLFLGLNRTRLCSVTEIAQAYGISRSHLTKVVHMLGRLGVIETFRGRQGGLRLAHEPASITLGQVVRHTEGELVLPDCAHCPIRSACQLTSVLCKASEAFLAVFDDYTLADMLKPRADLRRLLGQ